MTQDDRSEQKGANHAANRRSMGRGATYPWMDPRMDSAQLKKLIIAASGLTATVALVLLTLALAQRDARSGNAGDVALDLAYAKRPAEGIVLDPENDNAWPPPPAVVRANDAAPNSSSPRKTAKNPIQTLISYGSQANKTTRGGALAEPPALSNMPPLPSMGGTTELPATSLLPQTSSSVSRSSDPSLIPSPGSTSSIVTPPIPSNGIPFPSTDAASAAMRSDTAGREAPSGGLGAPGGNPTTMRRAESGYAAPSEPPSSPFSNRVPPQDIVPSIERNTSVTGELPGTATATLQPPTVPAASVPTSLPVAPASPEAMQGRSSTATMPIPVDDTSTRARSQSPASFGSPESRMNSQARQGDSLPNRSLEAARSISNDLHENEPNAAPLKKTSSSGFSNNAAGSTLSVSSFTSPAPGMRQLDGSQNPSMEIQKRAPAEVQVGVPSTFSLLVRNVGNATAYDVAVHDSVPKGAKLVRTNPNAQVDPSGKLLWKLGEIAAGAEQVLTVELTPESEGELGSVASVTFAAQASVRTMSTLPKLLVKQIANNSVLGGDTIRITIEVTNVGTGTARDVELEEDVPVNMRHNIGVSTLGWPIGNLAPGESERVDIELTAVDAGKAVNKVRAVSSNTATFESTATIDVVLPKLVLGLEGPKLRYLERQATYRASVQNAGTAVAKDVELIVYLPRGMEFNSAANEGTYFPDQHAVVWSLAELVAGANATTEVVLLPVQEGEFVLRMQGTAEGVRADAMDKKVLVEGQSELAFSIEDDNDPIETDGFTTYFVRVTNTGTRIDSDVQLIIELPLGAKVEQINAPVNYQVAERMVVFAPLPQMQPKDQQVYRLSVRHSKEGTHVLRAQLKSKNRPVPVVKEESTQVYIDR